MAAAVVGLVGCSTPGPKPDPVEVAFRESHRAVASGVEEGFDESEGVDEYVVRVRHNPCKCDAPPHEIYVHGRWTRARLEGERAQLQRIDETFADAAKRARLVTLSLEGSVDDEERTDQGVRYLIFQVEAVQPTDK